MRDEIVNNQTESKYCGNIITEMLPRPAHTNMTQMDTDIATFTSRSVKETVTCIAFGDIAGEVSALEPNIEVMISESFQFFEDEINRGDLTKPSDLVCEICALA